MGLLGLTSHAYRKLRKRTYLRRAYLCWEPLWGKMDPLVWVPARQPSCVQADLSARALLAASEPCGRQ